jgi:hypothetical protein
MAAYTAEACEFCATSDLKEQDVKMMAICPEMNRKGQERKD